MSCSKTNRPVYKNKYAITTVNERIYSSIWAEMSSGSPDMSGRAGIQNRKNISKKFRRLESRKKSQHDKKVKSNFNNVRT